ncbi:MAG: phage terminase large subunit family protein [Roseburia hominis]
MLDESSFLSGKWSNDITPYMVGIMDCFNDPYVQEINFCKPTQVGGTELIINALGYIITHDPAPTMIVYPSDELAKDVSTDRIKPSLLKTPEIKERFNENASKELKLVFRGMRVYLNGSNSPSKLASKAIRFLFLMKLISLRRPPKRGVAI